MFSPENRWKSARKLLLWFFLLLDQLPSCPVGCHSLVAYFFGFFLRVLFSNLFVLDKFLAFFLVICTWTVEWNIYSPANTPASSMVFIVGPLRLSGVTPVTGSLASNRNWTPKTGSGGSSWSAFLRQVQYSTPGKCLPKLGEHSAAMFCKQTFCFLHNLEWQQFSTRAIIPRKWQVFSPITWENSLSEVSENRATGATSVILYVKNFEANCAKVLGHDVRHMWTS